MGNKSKKVHEIDKTNSSDSETEHLSCLELHSVKHTDRRIIWVAPKVEGVTLKMELDTGSALSIISEKDYKEKFPNVKLKGTSVILKTYTGEKIAPIGKLKVTVVYESQRHLLDLYVLSRGGVPLFGREWLKSIQLNWQSIKEMHFTSGLSIFPKQEKLNSLLVHYAQVFQEGIGTLKHIKAHIAVEEDAQPKFHKARPVPYAIRPKVEAELKRLEGQGVLSKVNWSEWATPIVPVIKKNGAVRICGDFKVTLNPVLHVDQYPLPRIEDIFASLAGGENFSKIDLSQAYLQMELEESSKKYLTINTHKGLFRYNRLVFGVSSAPAMWQRAMDQVLQGIPGTQCYLDDIIVTGTDNSAHLTNLEAVLTRLLEFGLKANKSKCQFFRDSLEYCGHIIDKNGLHQSPDKIDAVLKAPQPENVTQLRSFLGLINYYHRFLPNLSTVLHPLNCLLRKGNKWEWSQDCEQAFNTAKQLITSDEVLTHFNPKLPLRLACDASPYGIGAVLSHKMLDGTERSIAFASRSLSPAEKNYAQIDREGLSLVWAVKKFNQYLYGKHFTLVTDHQPLVAIFSPHKCVPTMAAARLQRWSLFLGGHDYQIEFRGTKQHANADGLSHLPCEFKGTQNLSDPAEIFHLTQLEPLPITSAQIQKETSRDPTMAKLFDLIIKGWPSRSDADLPEYSNRRDQLSVCQGCIMWGTRVIVPPKLCTKILEALHEGHLGVVKMKSLARSYIWWPGIDLQIENLAKSCTGCQQTRRQPQSAPLHTWEWPSSVWQRLHIDYAGPFHNRMFLIVVDAHSKWPEIFAVKKATSSKTVDILHTLFARTGLPEQLVSDNGTQFTSAEFQAFVKKNGIKHITSVPYHPATNGLAERFIQSFKLSMKAMEKEKESLHVKIAGFLLAYRNTAHSTTGQTPAMLFLGRSLRSRLDLLKPDLRIHVQKKQCFQDQKQRKLRIFEVGHKVLARDYRHSNQKWQPGKIVSKTGPLTYTVQVGHDTVWRRHIDQLLDAQAQEDTSQDEAEELIIPQNSNEFTFLTPDSSLAPGESQPQESAESTSSQMSAPPTQERRYPERIHKPPERLNL
ncbi:uncharacterized protein K02A2.6-like [Erpetoichthys calabaricus]|uniref:uncharacterized protein K02A2.6-like n=1 Tax=Erpetoichthys calabaricus TaxID=27687 RepID=UPI0010A03218|nr:uncharacterized protein K02A2.6-like [Erpetoichthys calabaricus]